MKKLFFLLLGVLWGALGFGILLNPGSPGTPAGLHPALPDGLFGWLTLCIASLALCTFLKKKTGSTRGAGNISPAGDQAGTASNPASPLARRYSIALKKNEK